MPRFTITTDAGDNDRLTDSIEFPDLKAATDDAQVPLAEMAREKLPNGKQADFGVQVENEDGKAVYRVGRLLICAVNDTRKSSSFTVQFCLSM